jgi:hypothetical protein
MHKAAGADPSKTPSKWLGSAQAKEFIEFLLTIQNSDSLIEATEGRGGNTWAHWQLGIAYAKYLSPEFHAWCNEVVRQRMESRGLPVQAVQGAITLSPGDLDRFADRIGSSAATVAGQIIVTAIEPRFDAINHRMDRMEDAINGRKPPNQETIARHVRANWKLGGNCQCCGVNRVTNSDGSRAPHTHLDHFLQVGKKDLQSTWIVCRDCNLKKLPKDRAGCRPAFDAYQKRLIELFGREEYFGAEKYQARMFA